MRVKRGQHTVDGGFDQVTGFDIFDILRTDAFENIAKEVELFIDVCRLLSLLRQQRSGDLSGCHHPATVPATAAITNFFICYPSLSVRNQSAGS